MTQQELLRQVASATGESVATLAAMGFSLMSVPDWPPDPRPRVRPRRMGGRGRRTRKHRRAVVTPLRANVIPLHPQHGKGA